MKIKECEDLQAKLDQFTKPVVAVKDVEKEIFKVKSWVEKSTTEEGKKRKLDFDKEVQDIVTLRDAPPSKICKVVPAPRLKPPSPGIPKTTSKERKRERSTSPKSSMSPLIPTKNVFKRERSCSPPPSVPLLKPQPPVSPNKPLVVTGQRKKRKKEKDKKKT